MGRSQREYLKRINQVLDFIEGSLDSDLSLKQLAQQAHYSPYHFHRVFNTLVNEPPNAFVQRKRIERIASILLVDKEKPLLELAYQYGFNSVSSFSRAFKKFYGVSPTAFRAVGEQLLSKIGIVPFSPETYLGSIDNTLQWIDMNAQLSICELPELRLAGISQIGGFDQKVNRFQELMEWGYQKEILPHEDFKVITIYHDNPNVTLGEQLRISACITVQAPFPAEGDIRPITLKKGLFAVGHFEILAEDIARAWKGMCVWVMETGNEFRDGQYFEAYYNDHRTHPEGKFILDICIPLENTGSLKMETPRLVDLSAYVGEVKPEGSDPDYYQLISFMKELKAHFSKSYEGIFTLGSVYQGHQEYSYFSLKVEELRPHKLKFVLVLHHKEKSFSICLSGQNKSIRKKYWQILKGSDFDRYPLVESIDDSLTIMEHLVVAGADFGDRDALLEKIERESWAFMEEVKGLFDA